MQTKAWVKHQENNLLEIGKQLRILSTFLVQCLDHGNEDESESNCVKIVIILQLYYDDPCMYYLVL